MIKRTNKIAALVPVRGGFEFGEGEVHREGFYGRTVLQQTVARLNKSELIDIIILVVDEDGVEGSFEHLESEKPVEVHRTKMRDAGLEKIILSGRKWAMGNWRGGLGGATCYDEILHAKAMHEALVKFDASAGVVVGCDWVLVDGKLCDDVIERHLDEPEHYRLVFTQVPPGLGGCLLETKLMGELAENNTTIGYVLDYHPTAPQADPIGKETCVAVDHRLRNLVGRFIYDAPRWRERIEGMIERAGVIDPVALSLDDILEHANGLEDVGIREFGIELSTKRKSDGPATPGHHVKIDRGMIGIDVVKRLIDEIVVHPDAVVTFGGLGDALEHDEWEAIVRYAHEQGVFGIHVETDLHMDEDVLARLVGSGVDLITVNLHADTKENYERMMGHDGFEKVIKGVEYLLNHRIQSPAGGYPWVVPKLTKVKDNLQDLEGFFDRWSYFAKHAVIEGWKTGAGLAPDLSPLPLTPPKRFACRQLSRRMSFHANGEPALCDQDWLGEGWGKVGGDELGVGGGISLVQIQVKRQKVYAAQADGVVSEGSLCHGCTHWHCP